MNGFTTGGRKQVRQSGVVGSSLFALCLGVTGCETNLGQIPTTMESAFHMPSEVTLSPGDAVDVKFYFTPELDISQQVRPDGRITLLLVGDIDAAGKTPSALRSELMALYEPHLTSPEVAVVVTNLIDRRVYVGGQVTRPGVVPMPGALTALEAIMEAGGFFLPRGDVNDVIVIRYEEGARYGYALRFEDTLDGVPAEPFFLQPRDIIYVSRTGAAEVGDWVDQNINKIIPQTGFFFETPVGESTIGYDLR